MWVYGDVSVPLSAANPDLLRVGLLYPYLKTMEIDKCLADHRSAIGANASNSPPRLAQLDNSPLHRHCDCLRAIGHPQLAEDVL